MQKIGINKSKNKNRKYFEIITENKIIKIKDIVELNSIIVSPYILELDKLKNSNKIRISIKIDIKIIYLKKDDTLMYVYNYTYIHYKLIRIPKILEGHLIENQSTLNKLKKEIYVENINVKLLNDELIIAYFIYIELSISPTYGVAYCINNSFGDNIFLSHMNGNALTQKTFNQDLFCTSLVWDDNGKILWYISNNKNNFSIVNINIENKDVNIFENVINYENANNLIILNKNEILIECYDNNNYNICKLNLRKNELTKIIDNSIYSSKKPYYNAKNKLIYFLMKEHEEYHLYSIDKNNNIDKIFNYNNILDCFYNYYYNTIIIKILKNNELSLFEICIESKLIMPINLDYKFDDILDVKYLHDNKNEKQILVLLSNVKVQNQQHNNTLILYDFNKFTINKIVEDNIVKFDIDYDNLDVFIIIRKNNLSYVQTINLKQFNISNSLNTILKLPVNINDILIKKVNYEK